MTVQNRTAEVTALMPAIGLGIASSFVEARTKVVTNGFDDPDDIECERAELEVLGGRDLICHRADTSKPNDILPTIKATEQHFGTVDFVVKTKGVQTVEPAEDFPLERWDLTVAINTNSPFQTMRVALLEDGDRTAA
ncbi:MAG: SDR family NAD(P)-dependent oxidoreductase [Pseudomonadota bacterium]